MTQQEIRELEKDLWEAADELRGNSKLTAAEYKDPVLGLVLLRFAQNRYENAKVEIEKGLTINPRTGQKREATKMTMPQLGPLCFLPKPNTNTWWPCPKVKIFLRPSTRP
tara:strand:- start:7072 stop:7401 length:330 start_codon:yes stop_codon:yes gene_type:complete